MLGSACWGAGLGPATGEAIGLELYVRRLGAAAPSVCGPADFAGMSVESAACSGVAAGAGSTARCCAKAALSPTAALDPELPASKSGCANSACARASAFRGTAAAAGLAPEAALLAPAADCAVAVFITGRLAASGCTLTAEAVDPSFSLGTVNCASVAARLAAESSGFRLEAGVAITLVRCCMAGVRIRCLSRPAI